jgi:hypothetical protein
MKEQKIKKFIGHFDGFQIIFFIPIWLFSYLKVTNLGLAVSTKDWGGVRLGFQVFSHFCVHFNGSGLGSG